MEPWSALHFSIFHKTQIYWWALYVLHSNIHFISRRLSLSLLLGWLLNVSRFWWLRLVWRVIILTISAIRAGELYLFWVNILTISVMQAGDYYLFLTIYFKQFWSATPFPCWMLSNDLWVSFSDKCDVCIAKHNLLISKPWLWQLCDNFLIIIPLLV